MSEAAKPKKPRAKRQPGQDKRVTHASMSREIKIAVLASFNFVGAQKYLIQQAKKNPVAYMNLLAKCIKRDDEAGDGDIKLVVQQINIQAAPTPGVLASPVAEHVQPLRLVANGGEVIDAEEVKRDG